ncbi:MAG: hypothetical protein IPG89_16950 [Bacteroidetes bacterium]|nr:hypothetical protein [Bacteroidota bacterium]
MQNTRGGAGGGGGGTTGAGAAPLGGTPTVGGLGTTIGGGNGGNAATVDNTNGSPGLTFGGGGGGVRSGNAGSPSGGAGANGQVIISWTIPNETCASAVSLTSSTACVLSYGYSTNATGPSAGTCGTGNADDDLWYQFVATATTHTVTVDGAANYDAVLGAYNSCGGAQPTGELC